MEVGAKGDLEFAVNATFDRIANAPKGREGGLNGAPGVVALKSGKTLRTKGFQIIPDGDRLILEIAWRRRHGRSRRSAIPHWWRATCAMAWFRSRMLARSTRSSSRRTARSTLLPPHDCGPDR